LLQKNQRSDLTIVSYFLRARGVPCLARLINWSLGGGGIVATITVVLCLMWLSENVGQVTQLPPFMDWAQYASFRAINDQAIEIAESLIALSIVPKTAAEDALHVAIATVHGVDFLLTWSGRHIANPIIQARIGAQLESIGLLLPFICTPEELPGEESE